MKVILGADHGGFEKKERVKLALSKEGYLIDDVGAKGLEADDDFVVYAKEAVKAVVSSDDRILLFCRNGYGMTIAANRFKGIRCGIGFDTEAVRRGRLDDDINCLSIPADYVNDIEVGEMVEIFLRQQFSKEERYTRRIMKLDDLN